MRKILITGGFGFIGSNLVRHWLTNFPNDKVYVMDCGTYAARPEYVREFVTYHGYSIQNYQAVPVDICDEEYVERAFKAHDFDHVIHLAAESHVCNSIAGPKVFYQTNVMGTFNLLEIARKHWEQANHPGRFLHISTDEVFGQLGPYDPPFDEYSPIKPRSPYASSKAASDLMVLAYGETYGMDTVVTNCSNNYGPNQHEEKLIPKAIISMFHGDDVRVYGSGEQVRDWIYVLDHCKAIETVFHHGVPGNRYVVGGNMEMNNLNMINRIKDTIENVLGSKVSANIVHTNDRPTDDFRYAVDTHKIEQLGWKPNQSFFNSNLRYTVKWYVDRLLKGASVGAQGRVC